MLTCSPALNTDTLPVNEIVRLGAGRAPSLPASPCFSLRQGRLTMSLTASQSSEDEIQVSWVELDGFTATVASRADSVVGALGTTSSLLQGEQERILLEAQLECERGDHADSVSQESPEKITTPQVASEESSVTECILQEDWHQCRRRSSREWMWDWPSRPENQPPKKLMFRRSASLGVGKGKAMKRGFFSSELLLLFVPPLVTSHLLTLALGIYLGKRLAASSTSSL